jgi:DNA-binding response OmpR family regulator
MLEIRPEEHAVLTTLAAHPQRILTREELYIEVWGRQPRHADRSVDVYVSRLRSKLSEALPGRRLIHTHSGIGYRFSPDG